MRIKTRELLGWGDVAAGLLAGAFLLAITFGVPRRTLSALSEPFGIPSGLLATVAVVLGAASVAFAALRLYVNVLRSRHGRYLFFETPSGRVQIKAQSVEQVINRAVRVMDEVADARVALVLPKGALVPTEARVRCRLNERPNILAIQDQIRALVCDRYLEMFPSEDPLPVQITVENITFETPGPKVPPKPQAKRTQEQAEEDTQGHPFRAQYPVGD